MAKLTNWLRKGKEGNFDLMQNPDKEEYIRLSAEFDKVNDHYKRLRGYVDLLHREYTEGKGVDVFRRYSRMKGMIKRTAMHLKVSDISASGGGGLEPPPMSSKGSGGLLAVGGLLQGTREFVKKAEQARKRDERLQKMSAEEVAKENRQLEESIRETKRRINLITDLIKNLETQYNGSKRYFPIQRYRMMKYIVKNVTNNEICRDP